MNQNQKIRIRGRRVQTHQDLRSYLIMLQLPVKSPNPKAQGSAAEQVEEDDLNKENVLECIQGKEKLGKVVF